MPARSSRWHVGLLVALVIINLVVALAPQFFPYGDTPNHLARYTLIGAAWKGQAPLWVHFRWLPTGYIALDVVGAALVTVTSPIIALRVLVAAYVILLPVGTFALIRAVNPRAVGWSLVACLVTFNWYFLAGFLSYSIGIALALLWLAWWAPRRKRHRVRIHVVGAAGIAVLFLVHMAAAATALIPVGVTCIEPLLAASRVHKFVVRRMARRVVSAAAYFLPAIALNLLMKWGSAFPQADGGMVFRPSTQKIDHLLAPFFSFSVSDGVFVLFAYMMALTLCWSSRARSRAASLWPLTTAVMILCYFVAPVYLFAAWDVDVRFLLPALLIAFVAPLSDGQRPPSRIAVGLLFGFGLVHALGIQRTARRADARINEFLAAARTVPKGSNTLVLVADEGEFFRLDPLLHAGQWITILDSSSRINGLFTGGPNGAYLGHFLVCPSLYDVGVEWSRDGFSSLDWAQVQRDYDYIVLAGTRPKARKVVLAGAAEVLATPSTSVYRITQTDINAGRIWPIDSVSARMCRS